MVLAGPPRTTPHVVALLPRRFDFQLLSPQRISATIAVENSSVKAKRVTMAMQTTAAQSAREAFPPVEGSTVKSGHGVLVARRFACLFLLLLADISIVALALELAILFR